MNGATSSERSSDDEVRDRIIEFVEGARRCWGHGDIADYLRSLAKAGWIAVDGGFITVRELGDQARVGLDLRSDADDVKVLAIAGAAHARLLAVLRNLASTADPGPFAQQAIHKGWVKRSGSGWVPSGAAGQSLSDVLLAMVAADVLADASAYERDLSVCTRCGIVGFGARVSGRTTCDDHTFRASERLRAAARSEASDEDSGVMVRPSERRISLPVRAIGDDD